MAAKLVYSVILDDGTVAEAGTEETKDLRKQVPNPEAWGETPDEGKNSKSK